MAPKSSMWPPVEATVRNLTPHPVVIRHEYPAGHVLDHVIPPEPTPARVEERVKYMLMTRFLRWHPWASFKEFTDTNLPYEVGGRSVFKILTYGPVTGLPDRAPGVILIVSRLVAQACPDRDDLWFPIDLIRDAGGAPVACGALARMAPPDDPADDAADDAGHDDDDPDYCSVCGDRP